MSNRPKPRSAKNLGREIRAGRWSCPGCGAKPVSLGEGGEREWYLPHDSECPVAPREPS